MLPIADVFFAKTYFKGFCYFILFFVCFKEREMLRIGYVYDLSYLIWLNMYFQIQCNLHEVLGNKCVELQCKWRLVVPSASWCQKWDVNLSASCNAQDYFFWLIFSLQLLKRSEVKP